MRELPTRAEGNPDFITFAFPHTLSSAGLLRVKAEVPPVHDRVEGIDPGDSFFGISGTLDANPSAVVRRGTVTLTWSSHVPVGCPPLEWFVVTDDWSPAASAGSLRVQTFGDKYFYLVVTAHGRSWSRTLATTYVELIVPEKPPRP